MKTYKKIIYSLLLCGTIVGFSSCSKWLDVKPKTSIKSDDLLNSEIGFKEALIGVYIGMSSPEIYGRELSFGFVDVLARQYDVPSSQNYSNAQAYNYKAQNTIKIKDKIWETQYNVIVNINNILSNIDNKKSLLSPIIYNVIKGELLGLRAFLHLDLMRLYGYGDFKDRPELMDRMTIPYATTYSKDLIPQKSYKETIALIEKDLLDALSYLKDDPNLENEGRPDDYFTSVNTDGFLDKRDDRFNYWAACATLARLYYWTGDTKNALIYAEQVINSGSWGWISAFSIGNSEFKDRDLTFSQEHLFSLRTTKYGDLVNPYFIPGFDKDGGSSTNKMLFLSEDKCKEIYEVTSAIGIADYRYVYQFLTADKNSFPQKLTQREGANELYSGRIPLIRISEMYIIAIDAMTNGEDQHLAQAIEYFNIYRGARGIKIKYAEDSDAALLNKELMKELRKEFIAEGQLFYFYKRLNQTRIPGTMVDMTDKHYVVPYPENEINYGKRVQ